MYCKNCGQEVNDNAVVCVHCGASLKNDGKKSLKTIGIILCLFLSLIICAMIYEYFN